MVQFILENGANPNVQVETRNTVKVLACAAQYAGAEMVALLLDHGAEVRDSGGALVAAVPARKLNTVELLIARGADLNGTGVVTRHCNSHDNRGMCDLGTRE